jgi:hypothetical protein
MYVRITSVILLSYVSSGIATGMITSTRSPTDCLYDPYFKINPGGKQVRGPNMKGKRRRLFYCCFFYEKSRRAAGALATFIVKQSAAQPWIGMTIYDWRSLLPTTRGNCLSLCMCVSPRYRLYWFLSHFECTLRFRQLPIAIAESSGTNCLPSVNRCTARFVY